MESVAPQPRHIAAHNPTGKPLFIHVFRNGELALKACARAWRYVGFTTDTECEVFVRDNETRELTPFDPTKYKRSAKIDVMRRKMKKAKRVKR